MGQALLVRRGGSGTGNVFAFIVATYPEGSTCTCSKGAKTFTAKGTTIPYVFFIPEAGTWTVTSTDGTETATVDVVISSAGQSESVGLGYTIQLSNVIITGEEGTDYITTDEGNGSWNIRILTSQSVTLLQAGEIDVFCVGGGGGGYWGGGGGGYTKTSAVSVAASETYSIVIGSGGSRGTDGGNTTAFSLTANGGKGSSSTANSPGGAGGSGGGGCGNYSGATGGTGGSNGSDGQAGGNKTSGTFTAGGIGQGTTTREFGEDAGDLYAGGGGGGKANGATFGTGGEGGGANGGQSALPNTGGGGGGGTYGTSSSAFSDAGSGGSGIVIIRNHREVAA